MPDHNVPSAVREVLDISPSYYAIADFNGRLTFTNHALNKCYKTQYGDNHDLKHVDDLELVSFYLHKRLFWSDIVDACSQDSITLQVSIGENSGVYKFSAGIIEGKLSKCILSSFTDQVNEKLKQHVDLGKEFWSDEYMFRKKDGSYAYVFDKGYIIKNENGKPIRFIGGMVDITHVKENSDLE